MAHFDDSVESTSVSSWSSDSGSSADSSNGSDTQDVQESTAPLSKLDVKHKQKFILQLSRAFLTYGAPTHRVEKQLKRSAHVLGIRNTEFLLLPNIVFVSFHDAENYHSSSLHIVMQIGGIFLSQLRATHQLYEDVAGREEDDSEDEDGNPYHPSSDHGRSKAAWRASRKKELQKMRPLEKIQGADQGGDSGGGEQDGNGYEWDGEDKKDTMEAADLTDDEDEDEAEKAPLLGPVEGWRHLDAIRTSSPPFSRLEQCFIAFLAGFTITVLAFGGSTADAACAGAFAFLLTSLALFASGSNPMIAKVFELLAAFLISAVSRGLYSHTNHRLCYSAISSGGIVLILPGFAVMSAALELSHKTMLTGSLKLVWAIFQALFIGFVQTLGSDTWLRLDRSARIQRLNMIEAITHPIYAQGHFTANWTVNSGTSQPLAISLSQSIEADKTYDDWAYVGTGCYRSPHYPWYLQAAPWYASIPCIPLFSLLLAFWNGQDWRTTNDKKQLLIMVTLGCISYAANTSGETFIHGTIGGVTGAFAVSLAGSVYERLFHGFAFVAMVPGVLFLVPTGLTAVGGLAQNYSGDGTQFASGLNTGYAMITVSIGITVGLCLASFVVHFPNAVWSSIRGRRAKVIVAF